MMIASARKIGSSGHTAVAILGLCLGSPAALAAAPAPSEHAETALNYSLVDTLLPATRWSQPSSLLPLEASAGLSARHEIRLTAMPTAYDAALLGGATALRFESPRATYRYTLVQRPSWAWKVGMSSNLREAGELLRIGGAHERSRFGAIPLMHVGGEARLAARWRLAVDADGLMTARGRTIDIGLRVNYRMSPSFSLYGGWHLSESGGEAEESYGAGVTNAANFGVRFRF
jgi:hypothetical protein